MVEQGHIRVGPEVIKDPAFLVTRNLEDFVTWVDSSKIKQKVMEYNEEVSTQVFARATSAIFKAEMTIIKVYFKL